MTKMIFTLFFILSSLPALAGDWFVMGQGGWTKLNQDSLSENENHPVGFSYGGGFGVRRDYLELELSMLKTNLTSDIKHDGYKNKVIHHQNTYQVALNFYITKKIYAKAGYAFYKIEQDADKKDIPALSYEGLKKQYGLKNANTDGPVFGLGFNLISTDKFALYTQADWQQIPSYDANVLNIIGGLRIYFN